MPDTRVKRAAGSSILAVRHWLEVHAAGALAQLVSMRACVAMATRGVWAVCLDVQSQSSLVVLNPQSSILNALLSTLKPHPSFLSPDPPIFDPEP
eukprot:3104852-Rhodomonas_salina.1